MRKALLGALFLPMIFACASGKGRVEVMLDSIKPIDVLAVVGVAHMVYEVGGRSVWEAETSSAGANLYRITLKRNRFANSGDGEAPLLFKRHAERVAASQSCTDYRIVEFQERYDSLLIGTQRIAEGLIECVRA
jgi:hypothetical protein